MDESRGDENLWLNVIPSGRPQPPREHLDDVDRFSMRKQSSFLQDDAGVFGRIELAHPATESAVCPEGRDPDVSHEFTNEGDGFHEMV